MCVQFIVPELQEVLPQLLAVFGAGLQKVLCTLRVDTVKDHADGHFMGIECRLVGVVFLTFYIHFAQQPCLCQSG